ncbi:hypothetical protein LCGC14_2664580, partial [marine sediment metagenome]
MPDDDILEGKEGEGTKDGEGTTNAPAAPTEVPLTTTQINQLAELLSPVFKNIETKIEALKTPKPEGEGEPAAGSEGVVGTDFEALYADPKGYIEKGVRGILNSDVAPPMVQLAKTIETTHIATEKARIEDEYGEGAW